MNTRPGPATPSITVTGVTGLPEVEAGADLARLIADAAPDLADGDIVVVTSKIVSKAEGRVVRSGREQAIDAETVRVVARRGDTRIVETRHGLVLAAAGVDNSNTPPGTVVLLPEDPDGSARRLRKALRDRLGARVGVIVTDTLGRPWRAGQTDAAIGAAGVLPVLDHRGRPDTFGTRLEVTVAAVADEIAAAADLVKAKTSGIPVAIVRGRADLVTDEDGPGGRALIRPPAEDMFRFGSGDVLAARRTVRDFTDAPVDPAAVRRAVAAAITAPAPHHSTPWRFVILESEQARRTLLDDMREAWITDLRGDGFTPGQITRRLRRGEPLYRGAAAHRAVPARRGRAHLPGPAPQRLRAGDVRGRHGRGRTEPARRPGRRGPRLVLGVEHHVLPGDDPRGARPAARLGPDGRGRRRPPRRPRPGPPAPRPGRLPGHPLTPARPAWA